MSHPQTHVDASITPSNSPLRRGRTGVSPLAKGGLRGVRTSSQIHLQTNFNPQTAYDSHVYSQPDRRHWIGAVVSVLAVAGAGIGFAPAEAISLANAETSLALDSFSTFPLNVETFNDPVTEALIDTGLVESDAAADANASFDQVSDTSLALMTVSGRTQGQGGSYSGLAQGLAQVVGFYFEVDTGDTFSFNFDAALDVGASVDDPTVEDASVVGGLFWGLYDSASFDPTDFLSTAPLAFLSISSQVDALGQNSEPLIAFSPGVAFDTNQVALDPLNNLMNQQQASAIATGSFSQTVNAPASFTLVASNANRSTVKGIDLGGNLDEPTGAAVPEPSMTLALLLLAGGGGLKSWMAGQREKRV